MAPDVGGSPLRVANLVVSSSDDDGEAGAAIDGSGDARFAGGVGMAGDLVLEGGGRRITEAVGAGAAFFTINADPEDGSSDADIRLFRHVDTSGDVWFRVMKGDGSSDDTFSVEGKTGKITAAGLATLATLVVSAGLCRAGVAGSARGYFEAENGGGGNTPGYVRLRSRDGTPWHLFVEDDGTVRVHSLVPANDSDGVIVGGQS